MRRIALLLLVLLCAAGLVFAKGTQENQSTSTSTTSGPIVTPQGVTLPADAAPLDQQVFYTTGAEPKNLDQVRDIYGGAGLNLGTTPMLRRDPNQKLIPGQADSWDAGPNATYWDFHLNKNLVWSDGVPVTAADWVYTFQHTADPKMANPWAWFWYDIKGYKAANEGKAPLSDIGVVAINDYTVRIYGQNGPAPEIPALMAYQAAAPVPKHIVEKNPGHWADTIQGYVSCGPYIPTLWQHGQRLVWSINPNYKGRFKPYIQKWVILINSGGPGVELNMWLSKQVDLIHLLDPADLKTVESNPQTAQYVHKTPNFQTYYLALDTMKPPLNNLKVRQALSHAIDRVTLSTKVLNGATIPAYSMLPPGFPAYNPNLKSIQNFDVAKAKELLKEAGYSDPKKLVIDLYQASGNDPTLQYVKDQWETNLGITVNLKVVDPGVWSSMRNKHTMMVYLGPYEYDYIDPSDLLTLLFKSTGPNGSPRHAWKNQQFDDLVTQAGTEVNPQKRNQLYQQAEKVLISDVGIIPLGHQVIAQVWWPYLAGIPKNNAGDEVYRWLDTTIYHMYIRNDVSKWRKPH